MNDLCPSCNSYFEWKGDNYSCIHCKFIACGVIKQTLSGNLMCFLNKGHYGGCVLQNHGCRDCGTKHGCCSGCGTTHGDTHSENCKYVRLQPNNIVDQSLTRGKQAATRIIAGVAGVVTQKLSFDERKVIALEDIATSLKQIAENGNCVVPPEELQKLIDNLK